MVKQDELNAKLRYYFPGYVVNKGLSNRQDIRKVPKFVSEHLLTQISEESDPLVFSEKLMKVIELVNTLHPEPKDKDKILDKIIIKKLGCKIIDEIKVEIDEKHEIRKANVPSLNLTNVMISDKIVEKNEELLSTGIWGLTSLKYSEPILDEKGKQITLPVFIDDFEPFHVANINFNEFLEKRKHFTLEEWFDVLVNTLGLNPEVYTSDQKLLLISRFIPLVENNVNLMEFGPRATGKTYFYRNISFYTRIISGGQVTPAQLFYNIARRTVGEIGLKDCIVFDEISKVTFPRPEEMMGKLKDYMVDGHFERGPKKAASLCSLVFMGNIEVSGYLPIEDINYVLPEFMRNDSAFIDRIHGIIPGWEIPKIKKSEVHLSNNYGFSVDYFSEILHELRKLDFTPLIRSMIELENITIRDEIGIYRVASGLAKILFPNKQFEMGDFKLVMDFAVKLRQKVADLLNKMAPGEYEKKKIEWKYRKLKT
ncbi:MAG: BREX system Lon protease-like protein BrxL [Candidatus Bathyarchaeia archaeon]|nr:BREX system Lon protease-like protein BrxL [Candidatus Bathyarchaeota archaeon]